jgi:hypothetical protein
MAKRSQGMGGEKAESGDFSIFGIWKMSDYFLSIFGWGTP